MPKNKLKNITGLNFVYWGYISFGCSGVNLRASDVAAQMVARGWITIKIPEMIDKFMGANSVPMMTKLCF